MAFNFSNPQGNAKFKDFRTTLEAYKLSQESFMNFFISEFEDRMQAAADAELQLTELQAKLAEEDRVQRLNMEIAFRSDRKEAMLDASRDLKYNCMPLDEYQRLLQKIDAVDSAVSEAVAKATAREKAIAKALVNEKESEFKVTTAQVNAKNEALKLQIASLEQQLERANNQISTFQDTITNVAQASAQGTVTLNTGK